MFEYSRVEWEEMLGNGRALEPVREAYMVCETCGQELGQRDDMYVWDGGGDVAGCSRCLHSLGASDWAWDCE